MVQSFQKGVLFSLLVVFLFLALDVSGQESKDLGSFSVTMIPVNNSIFIDGQAEVDLKITNLANFNERFRIKATDVEWSVQSDPLTDYFSGVDIPASSSRTVKLFLKPTDNFPPGVKTLNMEVVAAGSGESTEFPAYINIRSSQQLLREYLAAVSRIVEIPAQIDPRKEFMIKVNLVNRNPKNISDMKILLTSVSTGLIRKEVGTMLGPLESKEVKTSIKFDASTPPVKDTLRVVLVVDGKRLEPTIFEKFEVISYSEIKAISSERKGSLLKWTNETIYINDGNVKSAKTVDFKTNLLKSFFIRSSPKSFSISKDSSKFQAWELELKPQETTTVQVVENYRSLFYLLLLGLLFLAGYRFFQSPVQLIKEASAISYKEGGVSELKAVLRIRNRSSQPYVKLTLMDRVPMIAEVEHDSMGTLKPATVFNDGRGSVVKWEFENLDRHEERIVAYKIRSKLSILGTFVLPKASLRFYTEKNAKFLTHSNTVTIKP